MTDIKGVRLVIVPDSKDRALYGTNRREILGVYQFSKETRLWHTLELTAAADGFLEEPSHDPAYYRAYIPQRFLPVFELMTEFNMDALVGIDAVYA